MGGGYRIKGMPEEANLLNLYNFGICYENGEDVNSNFEIRPDAAIFKQHRKKNQNHLSIAI